MQFTAKTFYGLEDILADELKELGAKDIVKIKRGVRFTGDLKLMYKANYLLRTALKILWEIDTFTLYSQDDLYKKVKKVNWSDFLNCDNTFAIDKTVFSDFFKNSHFAALRAKDAIVDYFKEKTHKRPSINIKDPDLRINLHISNKRCTLSVETSEPSLYKRGYRVESTIAPLNEVLASAIVLMSDISAKKLIYDPMCGSGTILIEAAYILLNIPAGYKRESYGFMKFRNFDSTLWDQIKKEANNKIKEKTDVKIIGTEINRLALSIARKNISNAGLSPFINIQLESFFKADSPTEKGVIITNPPYDMRIKTKNINDFYKNIGDTLKQKYQDWSAHVFSGNLDALKNLGLKPSKKTTLYNAKIKSCFTKYELYRGSKK